MITKIMSFETDNVFFPLRYGKALGHWNNWKDNAKNCSRKDRG